MKDYQDYRLFHNFIDNFLPKAFNDIDVTHPLVLELEKTTETNKQFYFLADFFQGKILFSSKNSKNLIGVEATELSPYDLIDATHPDHLNRITKGWGKLLYLANNLLVAKRGYYIFSTNIKLLNPKGTYTETLFQCFLFYSEIPQKKVYLLQVHTNIDWCKNAKKGVYYYLGDDLSHFRFPDTELLDICNDFTKREFEIIKMVGSGMSTEQIAEKLFLSAYTINTHRGNILKKSGKNHVSEVIYELINQGEF